MFYTIFLAFLNKLTQNLKTKIAFLYSKQKFSSLPQFFFFFPFLTPLEDVESYNLFHLMTLIFQLKRYIYGVKWVDLNKEMSVKHEQVEFFFYRFRVKKRIFSPDQDIAVHLP